MTGGRIVFFWGSIFSKFYINSYQLLKKRKTRCRGNQETAMLSVSVL